MQGMPRGVDMLLLVLLISISISSSVATVAASVRVGKILSFHTPK